MHSLNCFGLEKQIQKAYKTILLLNAGFGEGRFEHLMVLLYSDSGIRQRSTLPELDCKMLEGNRAEQLCAFIEGLFQPVSGLARNSSLITSFGRYLIPSIRSLAFLRQRTTMRSRRSKSAFVDQMRVSRD